MAATAEKERLEARISAEEKQLLEEAAHRQGQTLSAFVIASAHEAAIRTLEALNVLTLLRKDQAVFVEALLNPPKANARLKRAARAYQRASEGH
jgi:uncharacterized protein (DUF1778 family)